MQVGAVAVRRSGGLVMALEDGFWRADLDGSNQRLFVQLERDPPRNRMNDGKCDCEGRFWAGTMAGDLTAGAGNLYRLDRDGRVYKMIEDVTLSNGLGWSPDSRRFYFIDSLAAGIDVFDFDPGGGQLSTCWRAKVGTHRRGSIERLSFGDA